MADQHRLTKKIQEGIAYEENNQVHQAIKIYEDIYKCPLKVPDEITDENVKAKETAVYKLGSIYKDKGLLDELISL